ncbi:hypothetical protein TRFO_18053 [Tritrichomonas foetus]|uniref:Right handed beta helix domain-containing protein n=1 Tax=Tritrichomonas foetus TaxID=1144522 RepID=A0A1J4KRF6_9EUKA|nr:hypothetical protein TRFO_18053 [Tritrichomonas foetus]|eukprot:OHT12246.1 hypothetical protein TRFO_18053 [Tritrichomonas foetus]
MIHFSASKTFHVTVHKNKVNSNVFYIHDILKRTKYQDKIIFIDSLINQSDEIEVLQSALNDASISQYLDLDFNGLIIDGNCFSDNFQIDQIFHFKHLLNFKIRNINFYRISQPIFLFSPRSVVSLINCTIKDSTFNNIQQLVVVSYSHMDFIHLTLSNVTFNRTSFITDFQSSLTITNFHITNNTINDSSFINIIDSTINLYDFSMSFCDGFSCTIFESKGTVYFYMNNCILRHNNLFSDNASTPSCFIDSDFAIDLNLFDFQMSFCTHIKIFDGCCKTMLLSNFSIVHCTFLPRLFDIANSGSIYFQEVEIKDCFIHEFIFLKNAISLSIKNSKFSFNSSFVSSQFVFTNIVEKSTIHNSSLAIEFVNQTLIEISNSIFSLKNVEFLHSVYEKWAYTKGFFIVSDEESFLEIKKTSFPYNKVIMPKVIANGNHSLSNVSFVHKNSVFYNENRFCYNPYSKHQKIGVIIVISIQAALAIIWLFSFNLFEIPRRGNHYRL